ncbi:DEAD/DEAH box helicase [Marinibactrum halimedae]|uniref:Helicase/SNF2 family domain protein n=1 Tax=Marinibactrum halimedae TaxID=1444977 RepID=A0AA37T935_9GAMM|nr:DEAD/DEAH box helicase [Marinibactrum halimedae]MCD9458220.1 DEAD/DEAH box helicase [Marinibactrum halimedae]GLS27152.1 helicase/SNF2 family domain protein [Marinibactrum halimedae]
MISLSEKIIQKLCGKTYAQRGKNYFKKGNVLDYIIEEDDVIYGRVLGTHRQTYDITIDIEDFSSYFSECSCPVGYNCKHTAAILYAVLEEQSSQNFAIDEEKNIKPIDSWISAFQKYNPQTSSSSISEIRARLYFELKSSLDKILDLHIYEQRLGKSSWGKIINRDKTSWRNLWPGNFNSIESQIVELVAQKNNLFSPESIFKNEEGFLILKLLITTGRCFWQSHTSSEPIRFAKTHSLELHWEENNGQFQLHHNLPLNQKNLILLPTLPLCVIDTDTKECHIYSSHLDSDTVIALTNMPILTQMEARELQSHLRTLPITFPLPLDHEHTRTIETSPVPILTLLGASLSTFQEKIHPVATLEYRYDSERISSEEKNPVIHVSSDDEYIEIIRNLQEEKNAASVLSETLSKNNTEHNFSLYHFSPSLPPSVSALLWHEFIYDILPTLKNQGWEVHIDDSFPLKFSHSSNFNGHVQHGLDWFSVGLDVVIDGHTVPLLPILHSWLKNQNNSTSAPLLVEVKENHWLTFSEESLAPITNVLIELYDNESQLSPDGELTLPKSRSLSLLTLQKNLSEDQKETLWKGDKEIKKLAHKLKDFSGIKEVAPPKRLQATLRDYQQKGLNWLQFLTDFGFSGILADDMGLGKTLQTIAHLAKLKERRKLSRCALIVAPTSLLGNWMGELRRFAPHLNSHCHYGSQRHEETSDILQYNIIVTSYSILTRDIEVLSPIDFNIVVLDEAQYIKNPNAQISQSVRLLKSDSKLCLTGTPLENHLGELWSQFDFLMHGFLGSQSSFKKLFRNPIEQHNNHARQQELNHRIKPFLLRRTKNNVVKELPPKTEIVHKIALPPAQRKLYESIRITMEKKIRDLMEKKGLARSHIEILDALLKMRQACCHPQLLSIPSAKKQKKSAKLTFLMEILPEMISEGRKILIFSQFTSMLDHIAKELEKSKIDYTMLTGKTRKRDKVIQSFQTEVIPVFLISLKAGGVGLNLTEADTVIHFDPWWNPAAEAQATDRAHRIGQDKPVFVYKLIAEDTIEEKILSLQERKQAIADAVYESNNNKTTSISSEELLNLLTDSPLEPSAD